jgi:hypothetical protein
VLEFCFCSSKLLLKMLLQLLKEAVFYDGILCCAITTEDVVRQHTRKRRLGIQGLAIGLHALDTPSLRSMYLQLLL